MHTVSRWQFNRLINSLRNLHVALAYSVEWLLVWQFCSKHIKEGSITELKYQLSTSPHPAVTDDNSEYLYPYTGSAMHGFQLEPSAACTLCSIKVSKQINMHGGERSFITLPLNASYTTVYTEVTTRAPPRQNQYLSKCIHRTFDTLSFLKTHNTRYGFHKHGAIRVIHKPT